MQNLLCDDRNDACSPSTSSEGSMNHPVLPELDHEAKRASRKRATNSTELGRDSKVMKLNDDVSCISPPAYDSLEDENSNSSGSSAEFASQAENRDPALDTSSENDHSEYDEEDEVAIDDEKFNPSFSLFPKLLAEKSFGNRPLPPQLNSDGLGNAEEVWSLMCRKDETYTRLPNYFERHTGLSTSMRFMLLDWVMELCEQERLHRETFYLVCEYLDRYLSTATNVPTKHLQLAAATAILIATKLEEIYPPSIDKIANYTDGACTASVIRSYEMLMVKKLEWSLVPITSIHWLSIYFQLLGTKSSLSDEISGSSEKKVGLLTPPTARVPLAPKTSLNQDQCTLPRLSADRVGFSCSGAHHRNTCTIPNIMKDEFARVAKILDVCMLDLESLKFPYQSILPAALLFCIYEPDSLISSVTGYTRLQLQEAIDFVEPIVQVCLETPITSNEAEFTSEIPVSDLHNIQLYDNEVKAKLDKASVVRHERQKKVVKATRRRRVFPGRS